MEEKRAELVATKQFENPTLMLKKGIKLIIDVFSPLLPFLIMYGLAMTSFQLLSLLGIPEKISQIFLLIVQCMVSLVPFALLLTIAKKFETSEILAIAVALSMTVSAYLPALSQINHYNGQIIPAVLAGLFLVFLEKTLKKYIQPVFLPIVSFVVCIVVVQMLIGPIASDINQGIAQVLAWCFTSEMRYILAPCLAYIFYYLTKHEWLSLLIPFDLIMIAEFGYTYLWPMIALCQMAMLTVHYFSQDSRNIKSLLYLEKPMVLVEKTYLNYALICGAGACLFVAFFNLRAYSVGFFGIAGFLSIVLGMDDLIFTGGLLVIIIVPFYIITNPSERKELYQKVKTKLTIKKPKSNKKHETIDEHVDNSERGEEIEDTIQKQDDEDLKTVEEKLNEDDLKNEA